MNTVVKFVVTGVVGVATVLAVKAYGKDQYNQGYTKGVVDGFEASGAFDRIQEELNKQGYSVR